MVVGVLTPHQGKRIGHVCKHLRAHGSCQSFRRDLKANSRRPASLGRLPGGCGSGPVPYSWALLVAVSSEAGTRSTLQALRNRHQCGSLSGDSTFFTVGATLRCAFKAVV